MAEVTFPTRLTSGVTQTSDIITSGACVEASLRTIVPKLPLCTSLFNEKMLIHLS